MTQANTKPIRPPKYGTITTVAKDGNPIEANVRIEGQGINRYARYAQPYGFASRPDIELPSLIVYSDGEVWCSATQDTKHYPQDLDKGDVALYSGNAGQRITLKANGDIEISAAPALENAPDNAAKIVLSKGGDISLVPSVSGFVRLGAETANTPVGTGAPGVFLTKVLGL